MRITGKNVVFICLFTFCTLLIFFLAPQREEKNEVLKGMWVATVHNIDFPSAPNLSEAALKSELFEIVQSAKNGGYNAIFFQVRPAGDALYKSEIFPLSAYLGTDFDALKYLCELGNKYDVDIHAWINPYRVTASEGQEPFIKENTVLCGGKYYLDPGEPANISLVCRGVEEIVKNYDVAGIHFDDYFYPSSDFDDAVTYAKYGSGMNIEDWRRQNTYALIEAVSKTVKKSGDAVFGVSPVGIWRNVSNDASGSQTNGYSGYDDIYADALAWAQNSLVDYLAPQIYWERGNKAADFTVLHEWWQNALKNTGTKLYIGIAAYKKNDFPPGEIEAQTDMAISSGGYIHYNYSNIEFPHSENGKLTVAMPENNAVIASSHTYVIGYAEAGLDVKVNGVTPYRTMTGY
ncbi:MAG: family 10 glycosylhydrolase, partial [Clostridia bacterium]|nr:family 10 glycosylhydrolase [Clostridia bacterium]